MQYLVVVYASYGLIFMHTPTKNTILYGSYLAVLITGEVTSAYIVYVGHLP